MKQIYFFHERTPLRIYKQNIWHYLKHLLNQNALSFKQEANNSAKDSIGLLADGTKVLHEPMVDPGIHWKLISYQWVSARRM